MVLMSHSGGIVARSSPLVRSRCCLCSRARTTSSRCLRASVMRRYEIHLCVKVSECMRSSTSCTARYLVSSSSFFGFMLSDALSLGNDQSCDISSITRHSLTGDNSLANLPIQLGVIALGALTLAVFISIRMARAKAYEFFLVSHNILVA